MERNKQSMSDAPWIVLLAGCCEAHHRNRSAKSTAGGNPAALLESIARKGVVHTLCGCFCLNAFKKTCCFCNKSGISSAIT